MGKSKSNNEMEFKYENSEIFVAEIVRCAGKVFAKWHSADIYFSKGNNGNTRAVYEICSKLTIKTPEQCYFC